MRTFAGLKLGNVTDPTVRTILKEINDYLRDVSGGLSKSVFPGQQPAANPVPSGGGAGNLPTPSNGDLLYGLNGAWNRLPIGGASQLLQVVNSFPTWATVSITHALLSATHTDTLAASPVRGDLVVANSTPSWARFAVGTSTKFLRGGTDPLWDTIAAADLPVHDNTKHTDRTRRVSLPTGVWQTNVGALEGTTEPDKIAVINFITAAFTRTHVTLKVPIDYVSTPVLNLYFSHAGADTAQTQINVYTKKLTAGNSVIAAYDNLNAVNPSPAGLDKLYVQAVSISTSLAAGDLIRLTVERDGVGDGNLNIAYFLGADFEYTADS